MRDKLVLVFNKKGFERAYKTSPTINPGEVAIEVTAEVSDTLFQRPQLRATLKVDLNAVPAVEFTPDLLKNIGQSVKIGTGLDVVVSTTEPDK